MIKIIIILVNTKLSFVERKNASIDKLIAIIIHSLGFDLTLISMDFKCISIRLPSVNGWPP